MYIIISKYSVKYRKIEPQHYLTHVFFIQFLQFLAKLAYTKYHYHYNDRWTVKN